MTQYCFPSSLSAATHTQHYTSKTHLKKEKTMREQINNSCLRLAFSEKLNRLERIGAIPDVQAWKRFRVIRNALAHEYPDDPQLRVSAINLFLKGAGDFSMLYQSVREYVSGHFPKVNF